MANSQKGKIDMTTGHIMRNIILFAIPIIIGNVLQQLYTTVDALVIGCLLYTSPSPRDAHESRMPSSA